MKNPSNSFVFGLLFITANLHAYDQISVEKVISLVDQKAQPGLVRLDNQNQLWMLNKANSFLQIITPEGKPGLTLTPDKKKNALFRQPADFTFTKEGDLFVADSALNRIAQINVEKKSLRLEFPVAQPTSIAISHDGIIAVGSAKENVVKIFSTDGVFLYDLFPGGKESFKNITALAFAANGVLWVLDADAGFVHRFSSQRKWLGGSNGFEGGTSIVVDPYGFAYVSLIKGQLKEINPEGKPTGSFGTKGKEPGKMNQPAGLALHDNATLWVSDSKNNRLQYFRITNADKTTLLQEEPASRIHVLKKPLLNLSLRDAVIKNHGDMVVINEKKQRIDWIGDDGKIKLTFNKKLFDEPIGLALDSENNAWIVDQGDHQIKKLSATGDIVKTVGDKGGKEGQIKGPSQLAVRHDGSFVVADKGNTRVQVLSPDGLFLFAIGKSGTDIGQFKKVSGIATSNDKIVITDSDRKALIFYDSKGKFISETTNTEGKPPIWLDLANVTSDASGRFYVMDKGASRIRIFGSDTKFVADIGIPGKRIISGPNNQIFTFSDLHVAPYEIHFVPSNVENLTAVDDAGIINISWDSVPEAVSYEVYKATTGPFTLLLSTSASIIADEETTAGTMYRYKVRGVNAVGNKGYWANSSVVKASRRRDMASVSIANVLFEPVFTAAFKYYTKEPIGTIQIQNNTETSFRNLKLSLALKKYTDFATEKKIPSIGPGEKLDIPVTMTFNDSLLELTEDTPVQTEIQLSYIDEGKDKMVSQNAPLTLYSRNAISWGDKGRIASFITPKDPPVVELSRAAIRSFLPLLKGSTVGKPLAKIALLSESLRALGISYVPDPKTPYKEVAEKPDTLDYVQFPRETLRRKTGDCDDTTALLSALLESIGIETALVDTPGHIFLMANTEENDPNILGLPLERFIDYNGTYWVPLETTKIGKGFMDAWQEARANIREGEDAEQIEFISFSQASETYTPVTLVAVENAPEYPEETVRKTFPKILEDLEKERYKKLVDGVNAQIEQAPNDKSLQIQLAMIYVEGKNVKAAEDIFTRLSTDSDPEIQASAFNNLGNLAFLKGDYQAAQKAYTTALTLSPNDGGIAINSARIAWKLNDVKPAQSFLKKAQELTPNWKEYVSDIPAELLPK